LFQQALQVFVIAYIVSQRGFHLVVTERNIHLTVVPVHGTFAMIDSSIDGCRLDGAMASASGR